MSLRFLRKATHLLVWILFAASPHAIVMASAEPQPLSAKRGAAVVEQWCRLCHLRKDDDPRPGMGPPFEHIVRQPDRNDAYFRNFLKNDHFPMTTFRLFSHEKDEVVAYFHWLAKQDK